jgi:PAS domain S-box-containing protein
MKKTDLENRIKELELELSNLKSGAVATSQVTKQALEKSDVRFLTLANYIPAYLAYINADTLRYEFVNNIYEKSFAIPRDKIIGSHIKDVIGEKNYKFALKYIKEVKSGKSVSFENTFDITSGKRWLHVNCSPVFDTNSKVVGIALVSYDITKQKQIEEKLQLECQIISNMTEAFSLTRMADGILVYVHPFFERMFGYEQGEMLGKHVSILNAPTEKSSEQTAKEIMDCINENGFWKGEVENIRKNGTFYTSYVSATIFDHTKFGKVAVSIHTDITERKQAESELLESEKKFSTLINSMDEGYCIIEMIFDKDENPVDYRFLMLNPAFEKQTGLFDAEGKTMREFAPNHEQHWFDTYGKIALTGESIRFVEEAAELNRWYDVYAFRYGKAENRQVAILFNDITERKQIEESLRLEKENFRNSLDDSPLGVRIVTAEGNTIYANKAVLNIYGYDSLEELQKTSLKNRYTPESYTEAIKRKQQREQGNFSANDYEINIVRKNGEIRSLHVFRKEILWNGVSQFQVIYNDITERKQAEKALQESEKLYRSLFENMMNGFAYCQMHYDENNRPWDFTYLAVNKSFETQTGLRNIVGKKVTELIPNFRESDMRLLEIYGQVSKTGKPKHFEIFLNTLQNWFSVSTYCPRLGYFVAVFENITERKKAEEEIKNMSDSLAMLNNRLEDISENERKLISRELHDQLGQSLSALKIDIGWLSEKIPSDSEEGAKLKEICELLSSTIKNVQRISSELHPAMLEDLGLHTTMEWYCGEFKKRTGIDIHLKSDDIQFPDEKKSLVLYRILQEALTNVTRHANAKNVNINLYQTDDSVILEVIDDGIGIKKEKINSYKSLGFIGMRERAKKYNGSIDISSTLNKGTKLSVSIPFN